jgi:hypothetical protein
VHDEPDPLLSFLRKLVGTNTDAVLIDTTQSHDTATRGVLASFKIATTPDITTGIERAVRAVLDESGVKPGSDEIRSLTIGTTVCPRFLPYHELQTLMNSLICRR